MILQIHCQLQCFALMDAFTGRGYKELDTALMYVSLGLKFLFLFSNIRPVGLSIGILMASLKKSLGSILIRVT